MVLCDYLLFLWDTLQFNKVRRVWLRRVWWRGVWGSWWFWLWGSQKRFNSKLNLYANAQGLLLKATPCLDDSGALPCLDSERRPHARVVCEFCLIRSGDLELGEGAQVPCMDDILCFLLNPPTLQGQVQSCFTHNAGVKHPSLQLPEIGTCFKFINLTVCTFHLQAITYYLAKPLVTLFLQLNRDAVTSTG